MTGKTGSSWPKSSPAPAARPSGSGIREKPSLTLFINAGVYLLEPSTYDYIPDGERFDMTDLIKKMLEHRCKVMSYPIIEYWQDLGRLEDYAQAQMDLRDARI